MGTLEDKIAAETKLKQLKAEQQKIKARKKAAEVQRKRQEDNRRKILAGAVLLARVEAGEWPQADFTAMMDKGLTRKEDRLLFGLGRGRGCGGNRCSGESDGTEIGGRGVTAETPHFIGPDDVDGGYSPLPAFVTRTNISNKKLSEIPPQQIRAVYDATTIRVYQAYSDVIADAALAQGTFVSPPFKMERMTWIKPSFLWMMYRAGWGFKDAGQKRILAIDITREGFEWALAHGCLSHTDESMSKEERETKKNASPVRIQWDPERDLFLRPLGHRAIQIGLGKEAVQRYVHEWICRISDVTPLAHDIRTLIQTGKLDEAKAKLPIERPLR